MEFKNKMSREERAKQFMPFAALKGYPEALREKEKIFIPRPEFSEEYEEELDRTLRRVKKNDVIEVIYYSCGEYRKITGTVVRVDRSTGLFQVDESEIPVKDICQIRRQASNHKKESGEAAV